ncbi:MAG: CrcB family protein, partial [Halobacteriaceae archaeon]
VIGSFSLGLFTFFNLDHSLLLLLGTGVCGSFTTFSSFSFETVRLWETGEQLRAAVNAGGNLVGSGLALGFAWLIAQVVV